VIFKYLNTVCHSTQRGISFLDPLIKFAIASPIFDGLRTTKIPASSRAAIFDFASPLPPEIIAPACPIRLPGGAVYPAIKLTTGRLRLLFALSHAAASSSASPPISPIIIIPSVSGSTTNFSRTSMKLVPLKGSPPIPTTVD
jgi:hypothetical protein